MSKIGQRYLFYVVVLVGMATVLLTAQLVVQAFWPGLAGALPEALPEDGFSGFLLLLVHHLFSWTPTLLLTAGVVTFAFGLRPDELPSSDASTVVRLAVLTIVLTSAVSVLTLLGEPWVDAQLDQTTFRYQQARQLEDAYLAIKDQGNGQQTAADLDARMQLLKRLATLRPTQASSTRERFDYDFELQILRAHMDLDEFFKLRALPPQGVVIDPQATPDDLLTQAEHALASGADEEFLANIWATEAYRRLMNASDQGAALDLRLVERAKAVVDVSWGRIYGKTLALDERRKASYFFRKGKSLGDFQFQNYLEAYYGFQELHHENPQDAEVAQHWALAQEKVVDEVLFLQDLDVLFAVPGTANLVFLNRDQPREVVRIGRLLNTSQGVFVKNVEFLRTDARGEVLLHWIAPYGRWTEKGIDFRVWDKETPEPHFPQVLLESEGHEYNSENLVDPPRFVPRVSVQDLELVNAATPRPQTLGTLDLRWRSDAIAALGYNPVLFQTEFVVRLATPFAFFVGFLFLFSLAWTNRTQATGRVWWLLIPLLPLVTEFAVQSLEWAARLTTGGLIVSLGLEVTVVVYAVAFLVLATWALTLAAIHVRNSRT